MSGFRAPSSRAAMAPGQASGHGRAAYSPRAMGFPRWRRFTRPRRKGPASGVAALLAAFLLVLAYIWVPTYNDRYAPTIGEKHPRALGQPARQNWAELWDDLEPLLRRVLDTGETVFAKDRPFYIERHGYRRTFTSTSRTPRFRTIRPASAGLPTAWW